MTGIRLRVGEFSPQQHMPQAYSDDLRCKLLQFYERSEVSLEEVAKLFGVSYGFTKKIRRQQLRTGQMERPAQSRYGPVSQVTSEIEEQLRVELRRQSDLTLAELGARLEQSRHLRLSKTRLWEVLLRLELRRKKNRSTRPSRTARKVASIGKPGANR